jgi:hypothetical protein
MRNLAGWQHFCPFNHQLCFISDKKLLLKRRSKEFDAGHETIWYMEIFNVHGNLGASNPIAAKEAF